MFHEQVLSMTSTQSPTEHLFRPRNGELVSFLERETSFPTSMVAAEIKQRLTQKDYPCVAALRSYHKDEYQVGFYGNLGSGQYWRQLRRDLLFFLQEQKKTSSIFLSFWAVFEEEDFTEESFEQALWKELSFLTSEEDRENDWPKNSITDPSNPGFRFALGGSEFFIVGLHSRSARKAREFSKPALIFNVFDQFDQLMKLGQYQKMVAVNRERDQRFQGAMNPMVEKYGETWESIQFSGRTNPETWKCPFKFLKSADKP